VTAQLRGWLATRSEREQRLLAVAAALALGSAALLAVAAVRADLAARRARVVALERELAAVRRLAATLGQDGRAAAGTPSTLARLQAAADAVGLGERIAAMTPAADGSTTDDRVSLRIAGASLADTVGLLHALETEEPAIGVARFALRKHPDDATRFDLVLEATQRRPTP